MSSALPGGAHGDPDVDAFTGGVDIWLIAVLVAWLPVATALALLIGRTVVQADRRERELRHGQPADHAQVVDITAAQRPRHGHAPTGDRHDVAS